MKHRIEEENKKLYAEETNVVISRHYSSYHQWKD